MTILTSSSSSSSPFTNRETLWIIFLGIAFHAVYLFSIIDIYFRSPIIHGIEPQVPPHTPLAKRLVLFVGTLLVSFFRHKEWIKGLNKPFSV
jgi:hypothetical protein